MLDYSRFAFLVMTAEDIHADKKGHARENVVHEIGLFQGKLGFEKAIILKEEGVADFSNIHGLTYIPFPKGKLNAAARKEIRRALEREGIIDPMASQRGLSTKKRRKSKIAVEMPTKSSKRKRRP
jgi:predicted nucleotide-binding protein